jgi:hypothetical protein
VTALCVQLEGGYPEILSQRKQGRRGEWEGREEGVGGGKEQEERGGRLDGKEEVWILGCCYLLLQPNCNMFVTRLVADNFVRYAVTHMTLEGPQGYVNNIYYS